MAFKGFQRNEVHSFNTVFVGIEISGNPNMKSVVSTVCVAKHPNQANLYQCIRNLILQNQSPFCQCSESIVSPLTM